MKSIRTDPESLPRPMGRQTIKWPMSIVAERSKREAGFLNPPGKRHAHFAALDKNGVENGDLLGSVKRDRENDLLASRSMKKRIYNL